MARCLPLKSHLGPPGDGWLEGRIAAAALLWALLRGVLLRRVAFAGIEALVRSRARRALAVSRRFGDAALGYFTERLDPTVTRVAAAQRITVWLCRQRVTRHVRSLTPPWGLSITLVETKHRGRLG